MGGRFTFVAFSPEVTSEDLDNNPECGGGPSPKKAVAQLKKRLLVGVLSTRNALH